MQLIKANHLIAPSVKLWHSQNKYKDKYYMDPLIWKQTYLVICGAFLTLQRQWAWLQYCNSRKTLTEILSNQNCRVRSTLMFLAQQTNKPVLFVWLYPIKLATGPSEETRGKKLLFYQCLHNRFRINSYIFQISFLCGIIIISKIQVKQVSLLSILESEKKDSSFLGRQRNVFLEWLAGCTFSFVPGMQCSQEEFGRH